MAGTNEGRGAIIFSLIVAGLCNLSVAAAVALLWSYRPGSAIHPMIESAMLMLAGLGALVVAAPFSIVGMIRARRQRRWLLLAVIAFVLSLSPLVGGISLWNYVEQAHGLKLTD